MNSASILPHCLLDNRHVHSLLVCLRHTSLNFSRSLPNTHSSVLATPSTHSLTAYFHSKSWTSDSLRLGVSLQVSHLWAALHSLPLHTSVTHFDSWEGVFVQPHSFINFHYQAGPPDDPCDRYINSHYRILWAQVLRRLILRLRSNYIHSSTLIRRNLHSFEDTGLGIGYSSFASTTTILLSSTSTTLQPATPGLASFGAYGGWGGGDAGGGTNLLTEVSGAY